MEPVEIREFRRDIILFTAFSCYKAEILTSTWNNTKDVTTRLKYKNRELKKKVHPICQNVFIYWKFKQFFRSKKKFQTITVKHINLKFVFRF